MYFFRTEKGIRDHLFGVRGEKIGFVPTMGALHEGHKSLIDESVKLGCYTVVSIFVNPTQFNDPADLEKYPRTLEKDIDFLGRSDCDVLFYPDEAEMYKDGLAPVPKVDLGHLENTLEGEFRPGHFKGVMQVVARLLDIVGPDFLFMGQKDLQQFVILKSMIKQLSIPTQIIPCPIIREPNGLARSSRNGRIDPDLLSGSHILNGMLSYCKNHFPELDLTHLKAHVKKAFENSEYKLEYFEFLDTHTLSIVNRKTDSDHIVAVIAAWAGDVRLIDNMLMTGKL